MPLYDFHCDKCGHQFDEFKSLIERDEPEPCPECGNTAERQISATAIGGHALGSLVDVGGGGGGSCAPGG